MKNLIMKSLFLLVLITAVFSCKKYDKVYDTEPALECVPGVYKNPTQVDSLIVKVAKNGFKFILGNDVHVTSFTKEENHTNNYYYYPDKEGLDIDYIIIDMGNWKKGVVPTPSWMDVKIIFNTNVVMYKTLDFR